MNEPRCRPSLGFAAPRLFVISALLLFVSCGSDSECSPTDASCLSDNETSVAISAQLAPTLVLNPTSVAWSVPLGDGTAQASVVELANSGRGSIVGITTSVTYAKAPGGWLTAALNGTKTPTDLVLTGDPTGLAAGHYVAEVTITSPTAQNAPVELRVVLDVVGGPPVIELRPVADQRILQGETPQPTHLWVVNSGGSAPDGFRLASFGGTYPGVTITPGTATLYAGDSARFDIQASVPASAAPGTSADVFWRFNAVIDGRSRHFASGMKIHIDPRFLAGTVNGDGVDSEGTVFVWEGTRSDGNCCLGVTVTGPAGWNGGNALPLVPRRPAGIAPGLALGWTAAPAATGTYMGAHAQSPTPWTFVADASQSLRLTAPLVDATPEQGFSIQWSGTAASWLVSIYEVHPNGSTTQKHEELVSGNRSHVAIPERAVFGTSYRVELAGFSADLTSGLLPTQQVNMSIASSTVVVGGRGALELRPSSVSFLVRAGQSSKVMTSWGHNTGNARIVGRTYHHSNSLASVWPVHFSIAPGDSLLFNVRTSVPPGFPLPGWSEHVLFIPRIVPGAPKWPGASLSVDMVIPPAAPPPDT